MVLSFDNLQAGSVQFFCTNLRTGLISGELPELQVDSLEYRMGEITSVSATLPWTNIPSNWLTLTNPYTHAVVMCINSTPYWGGIILSRSRSLGGSGVELSLATPEHFLDQIYVTDQTFSQVSQTEIARSLIDTNLSGKFFAYELRVDESTRLRDRTYSNDDDKSVLHYIQNLMSVRNGIDFCHQWAWNDARTGILPRFWISDHIGSETPNTIFDESNIVSFSYDEDYSAGYGASRVMAYSSSQGDGETRPDSGWVQAAQTIRPFVEYKYSPGSSIVQESTLLEYAEQTLNNLVNGTKTASFTMSLLDAPLVWEAWQPGDVLGWQVNDSSGLFPDLENSLVQARVVGYELSFSGAWELTCTVQSQDTTVSSSDEDE